MRRVASAEGGTPPLGWLDATVIGAVRAIELADGPLDDDEAVRTASATRRGHAARAAARAWRLAERIGVVDEIERWRSALPWLMTGMALLIGLVSYQVLAAVTGDDRHINALGALAAVLTLPTLSLLLWIVGLALGGGRAGGGIVRWGVGLAARLPGWRTVHSPRLLRAGVESLQQARLATWALGGANHLVWTGAFACILAGLLVAFSFRAYTLSWETTILSPAFFAHAIGVIGWLPAQLGFPVPDTASVLAASTPVGDQRPWAWWLIGCTLVYGLAPRLVAMAWCGVMWRRRRRAFASIDAADPYFTALIDRFEAWDRAAGGPAFAPQRDTAPAVPPPAAVIVGFELDEQQAWPPPDLLLPDGGATRIAGTAAERRQTLDRLAQVRPRRLLIVCNAEATPDRGTARFLQGACAVAQGAALWLQGEQAAWPVWRDWLGANRLGAVPLLADAAAASAWLTEPGGG